MYSGSVKKMLQKIIKKKIILFEVLNLPERTHKNRHSNHK